MAANACDQIIAAGAATIAVFSVVVAVVAGGCVDTGAPAGLAPIRFFVCEGAGCTEIPAETAVQKYA